MLNKYIIKSGSPQRNIRINLGSNESFLGYQQEIKSYTEIASVGLINETPDPEMRKFKYSSDDPYLTGISMKFNFTEPQFTDDEISGNTLNVLNSFFAMETYDDFNESKNVKLSTNYFTKDLKINHNYIIDQFNKNQFFYLYLPESFILEQTGTTATTFSRFLFYNAKSGKTSVFYNQYVSPDTEEYTYFNIRINLANKTWKFTQASGILNINQIPEIDNSFIKKVNDNVTNFDQLKQTYPSGKTFSYITKDYFTLSGLTKNIY